MPAEDHTSPVQPVLQFLGEVWRAVVGWEGWYDVSSWGRVKRLRFSKVTRNTWPGKILKPGSAHGYLHVSLHRDDGFHQTRTVHTLVAAAFLGPRPEGMEVNHKDGIKTNNFPWNLEYVTPSENQLHAYRIGLKENAHGEENWQSKLTDDVVRAILEIGYTKPLGEIAAQFGITKSNVCYILRGKTWKHLGVQATGTYKHRGFKLSNDDIITIRGLKGKMLNREIAALFGVATPTITNILNGKSRKP
jgi:HNH endonuclease/NUMOD4 motif